MRDLKTGDLLSIYEDSYGFVIYEIVKTNEHCEKCGNEDGLTLQIVCNNNFGWDASLDELTPYNHKKGIYINDCENNIKKAIIASKMKLYNDKEAKIKKKKLLESEDN